MWPPTAQSSMDLMFKKVQVTLDDGTETIGWIYTIDPASSTIVLVKFENDDSTVSSMCMLPGTSVKGVELMDDQCSEERKRSIDSVCVQCGSEGVSEDEQTVSNRKDKLKRWLIKNRVPIEEDEGSIRVFDILTITSPFNIDNCASTNELVLARVRRILEEMPDEF